MPLQPDNFLLLNADGEAVPEGGQGEMAISSPILPGGYYRDTERSAGIYKADPRKPGHRLYLTGDLAYRDQNGLFHGLGRKDEQTKIRGYNVRPAEVEQMVQEHPGIKEAAVSPHEGKNRIRRLACHYVVAPGAQVSGSDLRAFLRGRAASYQVPGLYCEVTALPRTQTGKIIRRDLPDPLTAGHTASAETEAPMNEAETAIAEIWRETLDHDDFGLEDDFSDVGGDSLQAMSVVTGIERTFGVRVPLETLILTGATVARLAEHVTAQKECRGAGTVVLKRGADLPSLFVTHVSGGHLSDYLMIANALDPRIPLIGLHPEGLDEGGKPITSIEVLAEYCAASIKSHQPNGPYRLMGFSFGAKVAVEVARLLGDGEDGVETLILLDPPLLRSRLRDYGRFLYQGLRDDGFGIFADRLRQVLRMKVGLAPGAQCMDSAHKFASVAYWPRPMRDMSVLAIFAGKNPDYVPMRQVWQSVLGPSLICDVYQCGHMELVGDANAFSLARKIEAWLNR